MPLNISKTNGKKQVDLFLDSGAFSAWSQGVEIDIQEYIAFIKKNKNFINVYANLDAIGDPEKTLQNQKIMEKAGLTPIPCYHYGEDIKYFQMYIKKYSYVALGGMVPISSRDLAPWLTNLFCNYICDESGMPKVKIHGFGMTSLSLMLRFPWYSVDSTSWVMTGRMGGVLIPKKINGKYDYSKNPIKVTVSDKSPSTKTKEQHFKTFGPGQQKIFLDYFKEKGFSIGESKFQDRDPGTYILKENERWNKKKEGIVETIIQKGLCNTYQMRDEINIMYFLDLEKNLPKWPWPLKIKKIRTFF
jgi:hypothetical protein